MTNPTSLPSPGKGGAPPGNHNARKHGFYSHAFTKAERGELKSAVSGRLHPEIKLFKVMIARTAARLKPPGQGHDPSYQDTLDMLSTVSFAISRLVSFYRTNEKLSAPDRDVSDEFLIRMGFTRDEADGEIYGLGKRPSGGQAGNTNALKHGFYASVFKPEELSKLDKGEVRELEDELGFLRTLLKRTVVLYDIQKDLSPHEDRKALRVIFYAGACIEKVECAMDAIAPGPSWFDYFLVAIRQSNEALGVI
jgi:hypothetical protein